ncbi:MAG TPA: hypothetical protein VLC46_14990 [Thermoanaerobaculia bacterium]|nr:hypothetical protein [Thermoanaerobaculia bacterium]
MHRLALAAGVGGFRQHPNRTRGAVFRPPFHSLMDERECVVQKKRERCAGPSVFVLHARGKGDKLLPMLFGFDNLLGSLPRLI